MFSLSQVSIRASTSCRFRLYFTVGHRRSLSGLNRAARNMHRDPLSPLLAGLVNRLQLRLIGFSCQTQKVETAHREKLVEAPRFMVSAFHEPVEGSYRLHLHLQLSSAKLPPSTRHSSTTRGRKEKRCPVGLADRARRRRRKPHAARLEGGAGCRDERWQDGRGAGQGRAVATSRGGGAAEERR